MCHFTVEVNMAEIHRHGLNSSVPIHYGSKRRDVKIKLPVTGSSITRKEIDYVADAAAHAWYENAICITGACHADTVTPR